MLTSAVKETGVSLHTTVLDGCTVTLGSVLTVSLAMSEVTEDGAVQLEVTTTYICRPLVFILPPGVRESVAVGRQHPRRLWLLASHTQLTRLVGCRQ